MNTSRGQERRLNALSDLLQEVRNLLQVAECHLDILRREAAESLEEEAENGPSLKIVGIS